ncbi:hypothetical protein VTO42DRAFT_8329 [Malbranchea cinnamomea]
MSCKLWQYFLQDDVESFKRFLAAATNSTKAGGNASTQKFGSSGAVLRSSLTSNSPKTRKFLSVSPGSPQPEKFLHVPSLTRADVNSKDRYGRTLLHLVASSQKESAYEFATALLAIPFVDIYAQDLESGWTALHRALYAGNVAIAHALMVRDIRDATDFSTPGGSHHPSGGLIKIKDWEGNSPFDVFNSTVIPRDIHKMSAEEYRLMSEDSSSATSDEEVAGLDEKPTAVKAQVNLMGDEIFTFGSNKNLTLGLGDEDDRQFPERVVLTRPDGVLKRLHHEHATVREKGRGSTAIAESESDDVADIPVLVRTQPVICRDVVMSKLHTGILTNDAESNLFMCGFGPGGRLGTGDESTRFNFVCIQAGGLAKKKIVALALGQDHSIAVSQEGEVFTWGSNKYGQLGYTLPKSNNKNDTPIQTTPRQIFNPLKKEFIVGAAASAIHSVVFTSTGVYTFGKNEGQLGLIDSDARSLEVQVIPRKVGASLFTSPIAMVAAIDRATTCLLENHEVWVFTHYGYSKLMFPLDSSSDFLRGSFMTTRYGTSVNCITKVTSGGNTICAMSSFGEVYTVNVNKKADTNSTAASTTNPAKIRNSLPQPSRVWSIKKSHMAVRDVDVGQDGSIIICTESGSAWRKEKRAKLKTTGSSETGDRWSKDYKFVRIPGLSRVVAVRSNAFGAYAAVQRACDVTKEQIIVDKQSLWDDIWPLLPIRDVLHRKSVYEIHVLSEDTVNSDRSENTAHDGNHLPKFIESVLRDNIRSRTLSGAFREFVWISTTSSDVRLPVHEFMIAARSPHIRRALSQFRKSYYYSVPDFMAVEYDRDGQTQIQFQDLSFLSIFNLVLFIYTDQWMKMRYNTRDAQLYRQVRTEVVKLASQLELKDLEEATRIMFQPKLTMNLDMERAIRDPCFFDSADTIIELDGDEVKAHSQILCQRCPFFEGLFCGRAAGRWVAARRERADVGEAIRVDLKHLNPKIFAFVLRHIYADTDDDLFADVRTNDLDDFINLVIEVMAVADELMIDRLAQVCQKLLGQFVNTRNVCHLLNAVAPCTVTAFKQAAFEFICLNLEVMLENRLLDDLDPELLPELDEVCRLNQLTYLPVSRSRNTQEYALEKYPELASLLEQDRQRRIDSMKLRSRLHEDEQREEKFRVGSLDKNNYSTPSTQKIRPTAVSPNDTGTKSVQATPPLKPKQSTGDLMFQMDDIHGPSTPSKEPRTPLFRAEADTNPLTTPMAPTTPDDGGFLGGSGSTPTPFNLPQPALSKGKQSIKDSPDAGQPSSTKSPWRLVEPATAKIGLSDIMAEASTSKSSAVANGFASRKDSGTAVSFVATKLSQKERKKLQQQQMQKALAEQKSSSPKPSSPWQTIPMRPKEPVAQAAAEQPKQETRAPTKVALTKRQTIAGTPPQQSQKNQPAILSQKQAPRNPIQATPPRPAPKTDHPYQFTSPAYAPTPAEFSRQTGSPCTHLSLASILQEQQTEKDIIREAATAKHSLQDIQLEQEFQEWWDKESKRVQEEAAAAAAAAAKSAKAGRSSKGRGGRGGGKDKGRSASSGQQQQQQPAEASQGANANSSTSAGAAVSQGVPLAGQNQNEQQRGRSSGNHFSSGRRRGGAARSGRDRSQPHHPLRQQNQQPQQQRG